MAQMSDADRAACNAEYMRELSNAREALGGVTKADLRAAVNGLDAYLDANAAAINNAIPQPARAALTTAQKARLLMFVVARRYLTGA